MNTMEIQQDAAVRANYIPPPPPQSGGTGRDYVSEYENRRAFYMDRAMPGGAAGAPKKVDEPSIYDDIYVPILVAILFFLFHMPIVSAVLYKYARILHKEDGNMTVLGLFLKATAFGAIFYVMNRAMNLL